EQFLRVVRGLPISGTVSQVAYHLMQRFYLSHGLLIPDALIAATALDYGGSALYQKRAPLPDDPRSDGGASLLKAVHRGRFSLLAFSTLPHPVGLSGQPSYLLMDKSRGFTKDLVRC